MQSVLDDFNERAKEVTDYMTFLNDLDQETIKLSKNGVLSKIDDELAKTLKATAYLLLYNLVESTMRNAVQFIFDEIKTNNIAFDSLRTEIKKIIWQNVKKRNSDTLTNNIIQLTTDIIHITFETEDLFFGNVDAKLIREEIAKKYGFSPNTDYSQTKGGIDLLSIKKNRNDLAHGSVPFSEVGKGKTATELVEISERVIEYLRQILNNINQYLDNQEYLDSQ
ncbi:MAG: MAE_28990/MAE_18760 family HEPN-like nuclease [Microcystaceae cyanobacterium]